MSRPLRLEYAGALYQVTSRGDRREGIYLDDADRECFMAVLSEVCERFNWMVHAYCLMSNHYHLLIETPDSNLSQGMRQLNGVYTQRFNRKHQRVGHVFQGRYKAIIVQKDSYLLELSRYIVLNPVRARMVRSARDWRWSSYRAAVGQAHLPLWLHTDWILSAFGKRKSVAMQKYRLFISEGKNQPSPWDGLKNQIYLGDEVFVEMLQRDLLADKDLSEVPMAQRRRAPKALSEYERQTSSRNEAIVTAYAGGGYSMKEIGNYFGLHYSRISRILNTGKTKSTI
jgi:putative transposase